MWVHVWVCVSPHFKLSARRPITTNWYDCNAITETPKPYLFTCLWSGQYGFHILGGARDFPILENVQTSSGAHPVSSLRGTGVLYHVEELCWPLTARKHWGKEYAELYVYSLWMPSWYEPDSFIVLTLQSVITKQQTHKSMRWQRHYTLLVLAPEVMYGNFEVRHPRCVGSITKNYCVLHIQSNTTIFHLVVQ